MTFEDHFKKLKSAYISIDPPVNLQADGWLKLRPQLVDRPAPKAWDLGRAFWPPRLALAPAAAFFVITLWLTGTVIAASLPGDFVYPVKRLVENLAVRVWPGGTAGETERRAQEIIDLSRRSKQSPTLPETVQEYKQAVAEESFRWEAKKEKDSDFRRQLDQQRQEFSQALEKTSAEKKESVRQALQVVTEVLEKNSAPNVPTPTDGENKPPDSKLKEDPPALPSLPSPPAPGPNL